MMCRRINQHVFISTALGFSDFFCNSINLQRFGLVDAIPRALMSTQATGKSMRSLFITMKPEQNGWRYLSQWNLNKMADVLQTAFFKAFCWGEKLCILIYVSLKYVHGGVIDNKSALVMIMVWHLIDDKPLTGPKITQSVDSYILPVLNRDHFGNLRLVFSLRFFITIPYTVFHHLYYIPCISYIIYILIMYYIQGWF